MLVEQPSWSALDFIPLGISLFDFTAASMNMDVWGNANNDDWTITYAAQFAAGGLSLCATVVQLLFGEGSYNIIANYLLFHLVLEFVILGLITNAHDGAANTTNDATDISYAAASFGWIVSLGVNVYVRFIQ